VVASVPGYSFLISDVKQHTLWPRTRRAEL
jgi:hypothetical protein